MRFSRRRAARLPGAVGEGVSGVGSYSSGFVCEQSLLFLLNATSYFCSGTHPTPNHLACALVDGKIFNLFLSLLLLLLLLLHIAVGRARQHHKMCLLPCFIFTKY